MALSDKEKHKAVYFLGWSGLTLVTGKTQYNSVVNDRLSDLNTEIERIVKGLLERLDTVEKCLEDAKCRLSAEKVDGIVLNPDEMNKLVKERKRLVRLLSDHLDIPITASGGVNVGVVV